MIGAHANSINSVLRNLALILKEVLHWRFCNLAVVSLAVLLESSCHIFIVVVGALDFLLRKSAHTLDKRIILSRKYNTVLGSDANIRDVIFEALFLTLFKILFRLINRVSCFFVKLLLPLQENILSALKQS